MPARPARAAKQTAAKARRGAGRRGIGRMRRLGSQEVREGLRNPYDRPLPSILTPFSPLDSPNAVDTGQSVQGQPKIDPLGHGEARIAVVVENELTVDTPRV